MDYTESLWQWNETTFAKKRECTAEIREDEVRIWAYEDSADNIMFDESFSLEEWDNGRGSNEDIRALYRQFYDGLVPEGYFYAEETDGQERIPQGLLDAITEAMMDGTELPTLKAMMNSVELTKEECYAVAQDNDDIRVNVLETWTYGYVLAKADADNDGIEDIFGEFSGGGTDGTGHFVLFQGQPDGTYVETERFGSAREEFGVIEYDGKHYLIRTLYDYGKKLYNGFSVKVFEEGVCAEEAELMFYVTDYEITLVSCEDGYRALAGDVMENAALYDRLVEDGEIIVGSAEGPSQTLDDYKYQCDLDNDGEPEYYNKYIWTSSNAYTRDELSFECKGYDEGAGLIQDAIQERIITVT